MSAPATFKGEVVTLGCRLNMAESERIRAMLAASAQPTVVVNSCAVTQEAVRQTRRAIRRLRRSHPDARLLVTGCAADIEREQLSAMAEVDGLVANAAKLEPRAWLGDAALPAAATTPRARTRAFVPVQNGCDHSCTFCVIPQGRGNSRSLPVEEVARIVADHLANGAPEIVLTGVDVTSWGHDLPGSPALGTLVRAILDACPSLARLRLSSIDGAEIDPLLSDMAAHETRLMPHLHLSLQSGDDMILKRMKRRHSRADAIRLVERLKARRPDIAVGADLIAGFPTETDDMHANNLSIVSACDIVHGHIFPFSPRPGTPAARMPQVDPVRVKARAAELREAVAVQRGQWLGGLVGTTQTVLAERDGTGHAENFAPVRLPAGMAQGETARLRMSARQDGLLIGEAA